MTVTEKQKRSIRTFVCEQLRAETDLSTLTLGILKKRYLAHTRCDSLTSDAKSFMKQVVREELVKMQVSESFLYWSYCTDEEEERAESGSEDEEQEVKKPEGKTNGKSEPPMGSEASSDEEVNESGTKEQESEDADSPDETDKKKPNAAKNDETAGDKSREESDEEEESGADGESGKNATADSNDSSADGEKGECANYDVVFAGETAVEKKMKIHHHRPLLTRKRRNVIDSSDDSEKEEKTSVEKEDKDSGSSSASSDEEEEAAGDSKENKKKNVKKKSANVNGEEEEGAVDDNENKKKNVKKKERATHQRVSPCGIKFCQTLNIHVTLSRLKRYITLCGVHRNYKKLLGGCSSASTRKAALKKELEELGVHGTPSIKKCKKARMKREQAQELAELDTSNIITTNGRPTRRAALAWQKQRSPPSTVHVRSLNSGSDSEQENGVLRGGRRATDWDNLKGIISDDGDSC
uniref:HIRA-interacting protein 3-like n=1 Tax=Labrus bergylta TaxID=56723 RepID=A0A3Q3GI26_9LABR